MVQHLCNILYFNIQNTNITGIISTVNDVRQRAIQDNCSQIQWFSFVSVVW